MVIVMVKFILTQVGFLCFVPSVNHFALSIIFILYGNSLLVIFQEH